jgi:putative hemolysin
MSKPVRDIVVPAQDISMIPATATLSEALIEAHKDMHTRFPVCTVAGDPQTINGYVNFKDIIAALRMNPSNPTIEGIVRPIKRVSERMPLSQLLETMIRDKAHIVVTTTTAKSISGIATTGDILEEFVGKIEAEYDRLPAHIYSYGQNWIIGGGASMLAVSRESGLSWSGKADDGITTFAEWCAAHGISPLVAGTSVRVGDYEIAPRKFRRKKVAEAMVRLVT